MEYSWMSHVTYEGVMKYTWMSHVTYAWMTSHKNESLRTNSRRVCPEGVKWYMKMVTNESRNKHGHTIHAMLMHISHIIQLVPKKMRTKIVRIQNAHDRSLFERLFTKKICVGHSWFWFVFWWPFRVYSRTSSFRERAEQPVSGKNSSTWSSSIIMHAHLDADMNIDTYTCT